MPHPESGYVSLKVLLVLLALSIVAIGAAGVLGQILHPLRSLQEQSRQAQALQKALERFKELKAQDQSPESDGLQDPVWQLDGAEIDGYTVKLRDESSRLNLNWINLDIIRNTPLAQLLQNSKEIDELKQYREDQGYSTDLAGLYQDYFKPEDLERYFCAQSYANVNISFEECLVDLFRLRSGDAGNYLAFAGAITSHLQQKKLWTAEELQSALGPDQAKIGDWINTWPALNVHTVPPEILRAVLGYPFPDGLLPNASGIASAILDQRGSAELSPSQLLGLFSFSAEQQKRVLAFLGTRTWVWRISLGDQSALVLTPRGEP